MQSFPRCFDGGVGCNPHGFVFSTIGLHVERRQPPGRAVYRLPGCRHTSGQYPDIGRGLSERLSMVRCHSGAQPGLGLFRKHHLFIPGFKCSFAHIWLHDRHRYHRVQYWQLLGCALPQQSLVPAAAALDRPAEAGIKARRSPPAAARPGIRSRRGPTATARSTAGRGSTATPGPGSGCWSTTTSGYGQEWRPTPTTGATSTAEPVIRTA